jgi:hypothetical protein
MLTTVLGRIGMWTVMESSKDFKELFKVLVLARIGTCLGHWGSLLLVAYCQ